MNKKEDPIVMEHVDLKKLVLLAPLLLVTPQERPEFYLTNISPVYMICNQFRGKEVVDTVPLIAFLKLHEIFKWL
jgi:hypothetical protein